MSDYLGSCLCGAVKFKVQGEFERFYLCHCQRCQKDTGSAHGANLFSQSASLTWLTGADTVTTFKLAGTRHTKCFCKFCGSALPNMQNAGLLVVPAGSLDSQVAVSPTAHIFISSKAPWDSALDKVLQFADLPE